MAPERKSFRLERSVKTAEKIGERAELGLRIAIRHRVVGAVAGVQHTRVENLGGAHLQMPRYAHSQADLLGQGNHGLGMARFHNLPDDIYTEAAFQRQAEENKFANVAVAREDHYIERYEGEKNRREQPI
jgi:hypothetical protein